MIYLVSMDLYIKYKGKEVKSEEKKIRKNRKGRPDQITDIKSKRGDTPQHMEEIEEIDKK